MIANDFNPISRPTSVRIDSEFIRILHCLTSFLTKLYHKKDDFSMKSCNIAAYPIAKQGACAAGFRSLSKCQRCIYRSPHPTKYGCDYLALMGSSRGCPPGDQCTVFDPGTRLRTPLRTAIHSTSPEDRDYQEYYCDIVRKQGSPMAFRRRYG